MATLTLGLTSTPVTGSRSYTLSDADVDRWIAALRIIHKMPTQTKAQVLAKWADDIVKKARSNTRSVEKATAARTAKDAVADVTIT